jgi:hypothetical protein
MPEAHSCLNQCVILAQLAVALALNGRAKKQLVHAIELYRAPRHPRQKSAMRV